MKEMQNLYEVRKSLRFELLEVKKSEKYKFEENILKDIGFLNSLLDFESKLYNLEKSNGKRLQDTLDEEILKNWINNSFQIIKNQICTLIYNNVVFDIKPAEKNKKYENYLKIETGRNLDFFIPNEYVSNNGKNSYIPEEHFYKVKDSEIWYSIKLISKLIKDNELIGFDGDKEFRDKLKNIIKYNPNWESFFELFTLNPYTTKRWKKDGLENNYKIAFEEFKKQIGKANEIGKKVTEDILKNKIFEKWKNRTEENKTLKYFGFIFNDCFYKSKKGIIGLNHLILLVNKYDNFKNLKTKFKNDDIDKEIRNLNKKIREINKINSELFGYKIHLLDNFGIEKFSFLIKSGEYYFLGQKNFENIDNGVSKFQEFTKELELGKDNLYYLDSMTFGGFKKLFLSEYSDIKFEDGTFIKDLNKNILEIEEGIFNEKEIIREEINKYKNIIVNDNSTNKELKEIEGFLKKIGEKRKKLIDERKVFIWDTKEKKKIEKKKKYFNNNYYEELKKYIICNSDLDNLEKEYFDKIIELLGKIKNKRYKVGGELKDLSFLEDEELEKLQNLENLKNYFNDSGYKVISKKVDLEKLFELEKEGEIKLFQIKSKDFKFHPNFVNKDNCGNIETASNNKKLENNKKDLNTIYFESFFEDILNGSKYARFGADFKVRGVFANSKNDYSKFWKKDKNQKRHLNNKENIENFVNRFKRDRQYIDFTINLNATNHKIEEDINELVKNKIESKIKENGSVKVLSMDHGESSFLTYKIFDFKFLNGKIEKITEIKGGNFDNFKLNTNKDSIDKKQENIQIDEKKESYENQKILDNYITKYHLIIQNQKRERQVQEALKEFARNSISRIKEIISNNKKENEIKEFLKKCINNNKKNRESIFSYLNKFKFDYKKYNFNLSFPNQENLKEKIDNYISGINELLENNEKLKIFCNQIKESFDGKSLPDFEKLNTTPFYNFKNNFNLELKQINNLKRGYSAVLVGNISKMLINNEIDIITLENNILSYGIDGSKVFQKDMGTANHSTFIQALINKLSFSINKETKENFQFVFPVKATNTKNLKNKENGILFFTDENATSLKCPKCGEKLCRNKEGGEDELIHKVSYKSDKECYKVENYIEECNFHIKKSENIYEEVNGIKLCNGDDLACFNIANNKILEYIQTLK